MNANIAQMRANEEKLRSDTRFENRKFLVQLLVGAAALLGAGVALGGYFAPRTLAGQTIIVNVPPYTAASTQPGKP